jgi:hypothetical protein
MATAAAAAVPDARRWSKGGPSSPVTTAIFLFFFVVVVGVLVSARWITTTVSQFLFAYCLDLSLNVLFPRLGFLVHFVHIFIEFFQCLCRILDAQIAHTCRLI